MGLLSMPVKVTAEAIFSSRASAWFGELRSFADAEQVSFGMAWD